MKLIAAIFLLLLSFLTVQPLAGSRRKEPAISCCAEMMKCHKQVPPAGDDNKCRNNRCNPFMACAYGNFYLLENSDLELISEAGPREKKIAVNDNRLSTNLSESWHPPEGLPYFA